MVRCFGVRRGCVRVPGLPTRIACPAAVIVVRRQIQKHIVAMTRVWRNLTGYCNWGDFEDTVRIATVPFGFASTVNTGYLNTG